MLCFSFFNRNIIMALKLLTEARSVFWDFFSFIPKKSKKHQNLDEHQKKRLLLA